jgi:hypothetical protein
VFLFEIFTQYYKREKAGSAIRYQPFPDNASAGADAFQFDCPDGIKSSVT